jgi:hypothetical protein
MAEPQKDMSGVLFKNDRRRAGKEDPHLRGSCTIGGQRFWMDAWTNTVQRGERQGARYLSIKFRAAEERRGREPAGEHDDDIPF